MANNFSFKFSKPLILLLSLSVLFLLAGCSKLVNQTNQGQCSIVLTLSRETEVANTSASSCINFSESYNNQILQLSEFTPGETDPAGIPRSVARVLTNIEGYLVRIEGATTDRCEYYPFEEGQNELTAAIQLPAGNGYAITLLALSSGEEGEKHLLGHGESSFAVFPDQTTTVLVNMLPYKYEVDYNETFSTEEGLPLSFYILGGAFEEIFALDEGSCSIFYSPTEPEGNFNRGINGLSTAIIPLAAADNYECYQFEVQIPAEADYFNISSDDGEYTYTTFLQLELEMTDSWQESIEEAGLSRITLLTPDLSSGDAQESITAVAGNTGDDTSSSTGIINYITEHGALQAEDIVFDSEDNLFMASPFVVKKLTPDDNLTIFAGTQTWDRHYDISQDGGLATEAYVEPSGLALDTSGNLYIANSYSNVIRKVDINRIITTEAGNGSSGYTGDNIEATDTSLYTPCDVAVDGEGQIYIADTWNNRIRKVDTEGIITTIAGTGVRGFNGDGDALTTQLGLPRGIILDRDERNLYFADWVNNIIRKLDLTTGMIATVAGGGNEGATYYDNINYSGDPTGFVLNRPRYICFDSEENLYIADTDNYVIRKVENGIIKTVVGTGDEGFCNTGSTAREADLGLINGIAVDSSGDIYFAERNGTIKKVEY